MTYTQKLADTILFCDDKNINRFVTWGETLELAGGYLKLHAALMKARKHFQNSQDGVLMSDAGQVITEIDAALGK